MKPNLFGFPDLKDPQKPIRFPKNKERQSHYRAHIASICYPEITQNLKKEGAYNMPVVKPNTIIPSVERTIPFDRIKYRKSNRNSLVMFYINDDRFATKLSHPWSYTENLDQYVGVIGPDLSQYIDMDYPERLSNNYWNKALMAYWQNQGINIYPNVTWSLPDSYEYCADGLPKKSVIAINSMGVLKYNFCKSIWLDGYRYMLKKLNPICILRYGPKIVGEEESISIYLGNGISSYLTANPYIYS